MALNAEDALAARALLLALAPPLKFVLKLLVRSASLLSLVLIVTSVCFLQTLSLLLAAMLLRFLLWLSLLLPSRARERPARYLSERARTACQGILGREVGLGVELWLGERIHARVGACTGGHV